MEDRIAGFVRDVRRRNIRETVAVVVLLALIGFGLLGPPRTGPGAAGRVVLILASLGILGVVWGRLHIAASELAAYPPAQHPDRWRMHLTSQARTLRLAWLWYVLPLFAGIVLAGLGRGGVAPAGTAVSVLIAAVLAAGIGWLNSLAADRIERDRDDWCGPGSTA